jgi:hypothetical protein
VDGRAGGACPAQYFLSCDPVEPVSDWIDTEASMLPEERESEEMLLSWSLTVEGMVVMAPMVLVVMLWTSVRPTLL